jgi:hypothetical protein
MGERGCVTCLARREDERERAAVASCGEVDLRGQFAAEPAEGMVVRLARRGSF